MCPEKCTYEATVSPGMFCTIPLKTVVPLVVGVFIGMFYSSRHTLLQSQDLCPLQAHSLEATRHIMTRSSSARNVSVLEQINLAPVKPRSSQFNYDFRPYFVYSELGFRFKILVGVLTSESRLDTYAVAINNTWLRDFPKVIFFTAYSKDMNFHDKYNKRLNLNVVQLPDITDESSQVEFSFRVLQYFRDHYADNYNWFLQVSDEAYLNSKQLLDFLNSINSSADFFLGHPVPYNIQARSGRFTYSKSNLSSYCLSASGLVFSRTSLLKLVPELSKCGVAGAAQDDVDILIAQCIWKTSSITCPFGDELRKLFYVKPAGQKIAELLQNGVADPSKAGSFYPVESPREMLLIYKLFTLKSLKLTYEEIHTLQGSIRDNQQKLPAGTDEKTLHWPVGFPAPFKPATRFEVIPWVFFNKDNLFGANDIEPMSEYEPVDKKDINDILVTVRKAIQQRLPDVYAAGVELAHGYRRLDPLRGSEYIVDMRVRTPGNAGIKRFHLLRPFTKVEPIQMPAATEQKGVHLVLPVTENDVGGFEHFLQMYKRVCLQTGENVVLLTVFVNVRGSGGAEGKDDTFGEAKNLISRYKRSYMWAQLPWLQVRVSNPSAVLIMDIVSMKLPSSSLIFLVSMNVEFTINFLNRCRVNVVNGMQVFFPIPFAEYNPKIVYRDKMKPAFVDIHVTTGSWDHSATDVACFSNNDYKTVRMAKDDFLDEANTVERNLFAVFKQSKLTIFRALDSELRRRYEPPICSSAANSTDYRACSSRASERCASRKQLAELLLESGAF